MLEVVPQIGTEDPVVRLVAWGPPVATGMDAHVAMSALQGRCIGIGSADDLCQFWQVVPDAASAVPKMRVNGRGEDVIFFDGVFFKSSLKSIFFVS